MEQNLLAYLPPEIAKIIQKAEKKLAEPIIEIRLRARQALNIVTYSGDYFLNKEGERVKPEEGFFISIADLKTAFLILTSNSLYALERQLAEGFITIPGGHRVGFTGQAILQEGKIKTLKNINSLNYRLSRQIIGVAKPLLPKIYNSQEDSIYNTLIISPPLSGKTTILRDLIRIISEGAADLEIRGRKVGVVDERSELAGAYNGLAQNKIGNRTDLMDNCPKAEGILLLIRAMSPEVIAVDEIGRAEDVRAIQEAVNAGVSLIATVHGTDLQSVKKRPSIRPLIHPSFFQRYVILSKKKGIGTIEGVYNQEGKEVD